MKKGKSGEFTALGNFSQGGTGGEDSPRTSEALPDDNRVVMASPEADESAVMVAPGVVPFDDIPDDESTTTATVETSGTVATELAFPAYIMSGAAGEFAKLYSAVMETPSEFFYIGFLTCLGSVLADRLTLDTEIQPQPRLYVLLLGQSAEARKSTAITKTTSFFDEFFNATVAEFLSNYDYSVCWGIGSAEGLQLVLEETDKTILCVDELQAFVNKCKGPTSTLMPCVNTLFEANNYENRSKTTNVVLEGAYLSIIAASTVQTYERIWDAAFTDIGFTNRLFLVPAKGRRRFSIPRSVPERGKEEVKQLLAEVIRLVGEGRVMPINENASKKYDEWYKGLKQSVHTKRLDTYALRLMPLIAVNDFKTEVDEEVVEKVIALMNWQLEVRRQYDPIEAETKIAALEEKIRRRLLIREHSERELCRFTGADRYGLRYFNWARDNLKFAGDLIYNSETKKYRLSDEARREVEEKEG